LHLLGDKRVRIIYPTYFLLRGRDRWEYILQGIITVKLFVLNSLKHQAEMDYLRTTAA
jgi:hypothetical protein